MRSHRGQDSDLVDVWAVHVCWMRARQGTRSSAFKWPLKPHCLLRASRILYLDFFPPW